MKPGSFFSWVGLWGAIICWGGFVHAWDLKAVRMEANPAQRLGGYGTIRSYEKLQHLKRQGVNTVLYSPLAYQRDVRAPLLSFTPVLDDGMEKEIVMAKRLGFNVILQPLIQSASALGAGIHLRQSIEMTSEDDWDKWFSNYNRMIVHYAAIAQRLRIDMIVIGTEYERATRNRDAEWRRLILNVRAAYRGSITYAAQGSEEARRIYFWPELDLIGVGLNLRLAPDLYPTEVSRQQAWQVYLEEFSQVSRQNDNRRVVVLSIKTSAESDAALAGLSEKTWAAGVVLDAETSDAVFKMYFKRGEP